MTSSDVWDDDAAERYDETSAEMFAPDVLGPTVEMLARLADAGPALELAVGTGRVAVPLVDRGVPVTGIELSRPMVERLRADPLTADIPVVIVTGRASAADLARGQELGVEAYLTKPFEPSELVATVVKLIGQRR